MSEQYEPGRDSFEEAVRLWIDSAKSWLAAEHEPGVTGLLICAKQLDKRFSAATMAQFGLMFRSLQKQNPNREGSERDPLEALLDGD